MSIDIGQHNIEIQDNLESWNKKPLLRDVYKNFYEEILKRIRTDITGEVVELGSGIGNFKSVYPKAIATDIFANPWIDRVMSAYSISFDDNSLSNIVMFDVFHHLSYPGAALNEARRALKKGGRLIIFEPCMSLLGLLVYGLLHHEPIGIFRKIKWLADESANPDAAYYAAQGNASRIFDLNFSAFKDKILSDWEVKEIKKYSALSYILSGGFSKKAMYPYRALPKIRIIEKIFDSLPLLFATRMLVVLEKK